MSEVNREDYREQAERYVKMYTDEDDPDYTSRLETVITNLSGIPLEP